MTDLPTPVAARLQRPRWRDVRLVVGLILVLTSVTLGSVLVSRAQHGVPVYAARTPLVPGQQLSEADLTRVTVQLGGLTPGYVSARHPLPSGRVVLREVRAGELLPVTSVGGPGEVGLQPVTLSVDSGSAASLTVGSRVDVYVNPPARGSAEARVGTVAGEGGRAYAGPALALPAVSVSGLPADGAGLGAVSTDRPVQVMVPTDAVKALIGSIDEGARVTIIPVPGSTLERAR